MRLGLLPRLCLRAVVLSLTVVLTVSLTACSPSLADKLSRARSLIDKPDLAAARVQLKSVIQDAPQSAEARSLLGRVLLDAGEPASAEIELRRALALGAPAAQVVPVLARSLLALGQPRQLLDEWATLRLDGAQAQAELACALAQAQASLGDLPAARRSLQQALLAVPGFAPARLLQARVAAVAGQLAVASQQIDALLAQQPKNAEAWLLKADLLARQAADSDTLQAAYQQALALRPGDAGAHGAMITLQLRRRDIDAATRQLQALKKALPKHPQTAFYEGQLAFIQGDLPRARELFEGLLRKRPGDLLLLQSAGAVALRLGAPAQAEILLTRALAIAADVPLTRRLLAQCHLAQGQPAKALALLDPLLAADPDALALAAQAQLLAGNAVAAARLFDRVAQQKPTDPRIRTALALSQLAGAQDGAAIAELQAVAAADPGTSADLALVSTQLQRQQYGAALAAIDVLERKQPERPLAPHLRGQVQLQRSDRVAARAAFAQALARDAHHWPSVVALAAMDVQDGHPEAARSRLEAQVKNDPRNSAPRLALAELASRGGAPRETVALLLDAAVQANPGDLTARLALVDHHLASYQPQAALVAAQAALVALPEQFDLLGRLAQAQRAVGQPQQATSTYNRMVTLAPKASAPYLGQAEAQLAAGDLAAASKTLRRLQDIAPDLLPAQRLAITLALRQQQPAQALVLARGLQQRRPEQAVGYLLEGEVWLAQKRFDAAAAVLRQAVLHSDSAPAPQRLHFALREGDKVAGADAFASAWLKAHPRDALFLFYLGDLAVAQQDWALAEQHYQAVLALQPDHALALNNIAWLRLKQRLPGALPFAERAVAAAPHQPALLDTLAQALAANQQVDKAIVLQQQVLAMQPDNPGLRLSLARYYLQAKEKRLAKAELVRLEALGDRFAGQAEVTALSKDLGGRQ